MSKRFTVFVAVLDGETVEISLPSPPGDTFADVSEQVKPGERMFGYTYDELRALGNGSHELEERPASAP